MKKIVLVLAVLLALPLALAFNERSEASPIVVVDALTDVLTYNHGAFLVNGISEQIMFEPSDYDGWFGEEIDHFQIEIQADIIGHLRLWSDANSLITFESTVISIHDDFPFNNNIIVIDFTVISTDGMHSFVGKGEFWENQDWERQPGGNFCHTRILGGYPRTDNHPAAKHGIS